MPKINIKMSEIEEKLIKVKELMKDYSISQCGMADKIGMNRNTFKLKFNNNYPEIKFKLSEINSMVNVMIELGEKITLGISNPVF